MNDRYMSSRAAADYLDMHYETLRQKAAEGMIRSVKTDGGYYRFKRAWLDEYLEEGAQETESPAS